MRQDERKGLALAAPGFMMFSLGDSVIKTLAGSWPPIAAASLRFAIAAVVLAIILALREGRAGFIMPRPDLQLLRGFGITVGTSAFFSALFVMPLAEATAIFFVSPMITALLATVLLGEPARRSVWIASAIAFAGMLAMLRPNFAQFGWAVLLPLAAAGGMSLVVLGNRMTAGLASSLAMQFFSATIATIMLSGMALAFAFSGLEGMEIGWPEPGVIVRCAIVAFTASAGHWLVYSATTRAGAAIVAPMAYLQVVGALVMGWIVFHEWPDPVSMAGAALIISAGLYLWRRGRARAVAETDLP